MDIGLLTRLFLFLPRFRFLAPFFGLLLRFFAGLAAAAAAFFRLIRRPPSSGLVVRGPAWLMLSTRFDQAASRADIAVPRVSKP